MNIGRIKKRVMVTRRVLEAPAANLLDTIVQEQSASLLDTIVQEQSIPLLDRIVEQGTAPAPAPVPIREQVVLLTTKVGQA